MAKVKIYPAEGVGAHIRSVDELASVVDAIKENILITRHIAPPIALSIHDGLDATETTVLFGDIADAVLDIDTGILTVLQDVSTFVAILEMHITRTGGGPTSSLAYWVEFSVDGGTNYVPVVDSLRQVDVPNDGSGMIVADISTATPAPAGVKFRLRATNITAGTISIAAPTTVVTSNGNANGFSTKLTARYNLA